MPIRTQSADGVVHEFPDGMDQTVIDRVMKEYAQGHTASPASPAAAARPASDRPASWGGAAASLARGAAPYATGAGIGGAVAGPVGAAAGAGLVGLAQLGVTGVNLASRAVGGPQFAGVQDITDPILDRLGIERPGNWLERGLESVGGFVGSLAGNPPTRGPAPPPGMQQQLYRDFTNQQVTPRVPTVGQGRGAALTSNIAKILPFSGRAVQQAEREDVAATARAADRNAAQLGQPGAPDVAGERVGDAIRRWIEGLGSQARQTAGRMGQADEPFAAGSVVRNALRRFAADTSQAKADYGRFRDLMQGAPPVSLAHTNQLLDELMGQFPSAPQLEGLMTPAPIARAHEALAPRTVQIPARTSPMLDPQGNPIVTAPAQTVQRGGTLTWPEIEKLRSNVGYQLENPGAGPDTIPRGALKRLYGALTQDMEIAAQARGPDAFKALKTATGNYKIRMDLIDRLEPLITAEAPERVFARLNSAAMSSGTADAGLLRAAKSNMTPAEWGNVGATIIEGMGKPRAGSKDVFANPDFSPQAFAQNWGKLSNRAKDTLFGPAGPNTPRAALERLSRQATARQGLVKLVSTDKAETAFSNLNGAAGSGASGNTGLLRQARGVMTPQEWGDFGATVVARLGLPTKGAADVLADANFSPSSFATNWNGLTPRAKDIIFGPDQPGTPRASLEELSRVAQAQKNVSKLSNVSRSGEFLIGWEVAQNAWHSLMSGSPREMAGWAAAGGAGYGFGKILTDPRFARWLYAQPKGAMLTGENAARLGLSLSNALTAGTQPPPPQQPSRYPPPGPSPATVPDNLGIAPASPIPRANPFP